MKPKLFSPVLFILIVLSLLVQGCSFGAPPEPTATPTNPPTNTPKPTNTPAPTATNTATPTKTPLPTKTPNYAATEQVSAMETRIKEFVDAGYLSSLEGTYTKLEDFKDEMAMINYLQPFPSGYTKIVKDFVLRAHFKWESATNTANLSGCGFIFHLTNDGDYYMIFLDRSTLWVGLNEFNRNYVSRIGVTSGSQRVKFDNPAEADFTIIASGTKLIALVNDQYAATYSMKLDKYTEGRLFYTIVSGTNKDYGTRCEISNAELWTVK
ncbi:MAG: hypothetical protein ACOYY3_02795 [Chloroflexota bacterium]